MGEISGYNCAKIEGLATVINNTAQKSGEGIVEKLHSGIIVPMSSAWYAPEAKEYFESFATAVKAVGENIQAAFDAFRQSVQEAGASWASATKGRSPELAAVQPVNLNLSVSEIQEENSGDVAIDEQRALTVAGNLGEVEADIKQTLEGLAGNLSAAAAFLGHGQAEAVQACFSKVASEVHKIFKFLTEGDGSLQSAIQNFVTKYQETAQGIANAFQNAKVE